MPSQNDINDKEKRCGHLKEKTTKKTAHLHRQFPNEIVGVLKECYQKKQLARLLIKVKYLNGPWHWEGHRLEYKKKKKSKDKQQGVFLAQLEARKGSKGKVTAQRKWLVKV